MISTNVLSRVSLWVAIFALAAAQEDDGGSNGTLEALGRWAAVVLLVLMSGLFSGLTLGLLGLDSNQL